MQLNIKIQSRAFQERGLNLNVCQCKQPHWSAVLFGCHRFLTWSDNEQNTQIHLNSGGSEDGPWNANQTSCTLTYLRCCPVLALAVTLTCLQDTNIKSSCGGGGLEYLC